MKQIIRTEKAPKPVSLYSQAVRAGKFLFASGQLAIYPKDGKILDESVGKENSSINGKHQSDTANRRLRFR